MIYFIFCAYLILLIPIFSIANTWTSDIKLVNEHVEKLCQPLKSWKSSCALEEERAWAIYRDKSFNRSGPGFNENDLNCRKLCANSLNCFAITHNFSMKCWVNSAPFLKKSLDEVAGFELSILSCCKIKSKPVIKTNKVISENAISNCTRWLSRSVVCNKPIWVSYHNKAMTYGNIDSFYESKDLKCREACNNYSNCISFQFNRRVGKCTLKYGIHSLINIFEETTFVLHCCDNDIMDVIDAPTECHPGNKCKFHETRLWRLFRDKSFKTNLSSPIQLGSFLCRRQCYKNKNCKAVVVNDKGECFNVINDLDLQNNLIEQNNSDVFVFFCCSSLEKSIVLSTDLETNQDHNGIIKTNTSSCVPLSDKKAFCLNPQWMKLNNRGFKNESFGVIKQLNKSSDVECYNECILLSSCLGYEYNYTNQLCRLGYRNLAYLENLTNATVGRLMCCGVENVENQICYVDEFDKKQTKCKNGYKFTTVFENQVDCKKNHSAQLKKGTKSTISTIIVGNLMECFNECNKRKCISFEINKKTGKCKIKSTLEICVIKKRGQNIRVYEACCKRIHFPSVLGNQLNTECHSMNNGFLYSGNNFSVSHSGNFCANWKEVREDIPLYQFPNKDNDHNYCRNLDSDINDPWCIISGKYLYETCSKVPICITLYQNAPETDICYDPKKEEIPGKCSRQLHTLSWIRDTNIFCPTNNSIYQGKKQKMIEFCQKDCENDKKCKSFIFDNSGTCYLKDEVDICEVFRFKTGTENHTRMWIGCCRSINTTAILNGKEKRNMCLNPYNYEKVIYDGYLTTSGHSNKCLNWREVKQSFNKNLFPLSMNDHNYCRNINNDPDGPWCIVSGSYSYEYCDGIPTCPKEYKEADDSEICYIKGNKTDCEEKEDELKWAHDKNVTCSSSDESTLSTNEVINFVHCKVLCQKNQSCVSIEISSTLPDKYKCVLKKKVEKCEINKDHHKQNISRLWLGCCKKMLFPKRTGSEKLNMCVDNSSTFFDGYTNKSKKNELCLNWKETKPSIEMKEFPYSMNNNSFCRNPNDDPKGPWCIISGTFLYEYCNITECPKEYEDAGSNDVCDEDKVQSHNLSCSESDQKVKWLRDTNVYCNNTKANETQNQTKLEVINPLHCKTYCRLDTNCISFEIEPAKKKGHERMVYFCLLRKSMDDCVKTEEKGISRLWLGCCKIIQTAKETKLEKSQSNEICYPVEKENPKCSKSDYKEKWVEEKNVECVSSNKNIISSKDVNLDDSCYAWCNSHNDCASFEMKKVKTVSRCVMKSEVEICKKTKVNESNNYYRVWKGCCKKLSFESNPGAPVKNCINLKNKEQIIYDGDVDVSITNHKCLPWDTLDLALNATQFPNSNNSHNLCRNINNDPKGPWCITSGSYFYEYCTVPDCPFEYEKAKSNEHCHPINDFHTTKECSDSNQQIKWVHDRHVICTDNVNNTIEQKTVINIEYCHIYCHFNQNCSSFEVKPINSGWFSCIFKAKIENCMTKQIDGYSRMWVGCCLEKKSESTNRILITERHFLGLSLRYWYFILPLLVSLLVVIPICFLRKMLKTLKTEPEDGMLAKYLFKGSSDSESEISIKK